MTTLDPSITGRRRRGAGSKAKEPRRRKARSPPALTMSVPEAGAKYFGLSKNGSYEAAERGDIPTIKVGKLLRVPVKAMELILERACRLPVPREAAGGGMT
jgi:hypothetical protein